MRSQSLISFAKHLNVLCEKDLQITGFQVDSRLVQSGNLFFALKGERVDGHQFLGEAKQRGAVGAVVSKSYRGCDFGLILLPVEDVLESLQELACFELKESGVQVVGITGSVGKTTTKDFLAELLKAKYRVGKTPCNYNTKLTLPLSILNREGGEEVFVLEMGMSEPGDIRKLLRIAQPEVAVVTKIALAHAAYFPGGLEEIAKEKAEIFSSLKLRSAIYDHDLTRFEGVTEKISVEKVSFSLENRDADYFLSSLEDKDFVDEKGIRAYQFLLPFRQRHVLHNFLAATCAARQMKLEWDEINARVRLLELPKMRFEVLEKQGVTYINDAYNANPESMRAALESLPTPKEGGKRIAILGAMSPLGNFSEGAHREVGRMAQKNVDHLLVFGEEAFPLFESFQEVKKPAEFFVHLDNLIERLRALTNPGDVVLVKGSRIMRMEMIFEHFVDTL